MPPPIHQQESQSRSIRDQNSEALQEAREAHQWALEAAHALEWGIERLSWEMGDTPHPCPCSCNGICPWSKSLDRSTRPPSCHRSERRVTFQELEVESESGRPYGEFLECPLRMNIERSNRVPPPIWGWDVVHPQEMLNLSRGNDYPPEPSIKNIKIWLDWQVHLMDIPYWWEELIAIPEVEDSKKLAQKIKAYFSIPAVRDEIFLDQGYTVPPAPKYLTRSRFFLDDLTYQDIWQQPLLMMVAYARALQYWVEWANPPVHPDDCPLAMSVIELMQQVRGHITFYKWDVLQNLEKVAQEAGDRDPANPWGHPIAQLTPIDVRGRSSDSMGAPRAHNLLFFCLQRMPHKWFLHLQWSMLAIHHLALQTSYWEEVPCPFWPNLR